MTSYCHEFCSDLQFANHATVPCCNYIVVYMQTVFVLLSVKLKEISAIEGEPSGCIWACTKGGGKKLDHSFLCYVVKCSFVLWRPCVHLCLVGVFHLFLFILSLIPKYFVSHALHLKAFFICEVSKYNVLEITS